MLGAGLRLTDDHLIAVLGDERDPGHGREADPLSIDVFCSQALSSGLHGDDPPALGDAQTVSDRSDTVARTYFPAVTLNGSVGFGTGGYGLFEPPA